MSSDRPEDADRTKPEQRQRRMRRVQVVMAIVAACMGLFAFSSVAGNPRFETYHTLDVIRLVAAGVCFGTAFVVLMQFFFLPDPRSEDKKGKDQGTS